MDWCQVELAQAFLDSAEVARRIKELKRAEAVYFQGDTTNSVMYLQEGGVKLAPGLELPR